MRDDWERRAQQDAREFIATGQADEFRFGLSGLADCNSILADVHQHLRRDTVVLEIGCGIGRLLRFLALLFDEVHGLDVAPEMIRQSKEYLAGSPNVTTWCGDGSSLRPLADHSIGFVFSYVVFQHIPLKEVIRDYVHEVRRVLVPGGLFKFLVKYRRWTEGEDPGTWDGADLTPEDIHTWCAETGFELLSGYTIDEHLAWVILRSPT
jgi:SAM-dependent methyltransferase